MKRLILGAVMLLGSLSLAYGQGSEAFTPGGARVPTITNLCTNPAGQAVFCSTSAAGGYPSGATPVTNSATGTTGVVTATLPGVAGKTTYVCGWTISSTATAGINGAATLTGTISGTMSYLQGVGVAPAIVTQPQNYNPCLPASAVNTAIAINSIAAGTAGVTTVTIQGFQL